MIGDMRKDRLTKQNFKEVVLSVYDLSFDNEA